MLRILFVCHGNICRSPMAEFIMKDLVRQIGKERDFLIASSATSDEEIYDGVGEPVYPPARDMLRRHGISCEGKRAVQLTKADYGKYDLLVGMDGANLYHMRRILGGDPEGKIRRLMDYTDTPADVADPWYSDRFDIAYRDIRKGCEALLDHILKNHFHQKGYTI